jgi:hypothetical protein
MMVAKSAHTLCANNTVRILQRTNREQTPYRTALVSLTAEAKPVSTQICCTNARHNCGPAIHTTGSSDTDRLRAAVV